MTRPQPAAEPTARFRELVSHRAFALDVAAVLIGVHGEPDVDADAVLADLDELAGGVAAPTADAVLSALYGGHGLRGDIDTYDDPRNSYLHQVLGRGLGIPISLAVVVIEVGRRCGVAFAGVNAPGHFMVHVVGGGDYVDPFSGRRMSEVEVSRFFAERFPGADVTRLDEVGADRIVDRMLANLVGSFQRRGDRHGLLWATELRTYLPTATPEHHHAHGLALAHAGAFLEAADVFDALAEDTTDPDRVRSLAAGMRARLN